MSGILMTSARYFKMDTYDSANANQTLKAFRIYSKAAPDATFVDIEKKMREDNFNIYTCALVRYNHSGMSDLA